MNYGTTVVESKLYYVLLISVLLSGYISLEEFSEACNLIKEHMPNPITQEQLVDICKLMDMNKDGLVDLNEFLETFRMVDPEQSGKYSRPEERSPVFNVTTTTAQVLPRENGTAHQKIPNSNSQDLLKPNMNGEPVANSNTAINSIDASIPSSPTSPIKKHTNTLTKSPVLSSRRVD